jgi:hypothetical protein
MWKFAIPASVAALRKSVLDMRVKISLLSIEVVPNLAKQGPEDYSSAVIEHVGHRQNQVEFLRELWRMGRSGIFVTTPNRWHDRRRSLSAGAAHPRAPRHLG